MTEVTQLLHAMNRGDPQAAAALLPLVYDELRGLAAARMAAMTGATLARFKDYKDVDSALNLHSTRVTDAGLANLNRHQWGAILAGGGVLGALRQGGVQASACGGAAKSGGVHDQH